MKLNNNTPLIKNRVLYPCYLVFLGLIFFVSCFNEDLDSTLKQENEIGSTPPQQSIDLPIPGNAGVITSTSIASEELTVTWAKATDAHTAPEDIEYRVFRSDVPNISTPDDAEGNGVPASSWTKNISSLKIQGLSSGTTHFFNIVAKGAGDRKSAYLTASATTKGIIYMYAISARPGNLTSSGREGIDNLCKPIPVANCSNVRAFISINQADTIKGMPANYDVPSGWPIQSISGKLIAWNWADMLDGSINMKLEDAGISIPLLSNTLVVSTFWWSGSTESGDLAVNGTCSEWTGGTNSSAGMQGAHNRIDSDWLSYGTANCNTSKQVVCVAW